MADLGLSPESALEQATRSALIRSALLGGTIALVAILAVSGGNFERMSVSDGRLARVVAAHLSAAPDEIAQPVVERGTSLRYGRIGLPAVLWLASAGRPTAMPYVQPAIMVLAAASASAATTAILGGSAPILAVTPFLAIGFFLSVVGGFADALGIAFGLVAVAMSVRQKWWGAAGFLSAAILTRENAGAVLVGICVWCALQQRWRPMGILSLSLVPVLAWHTFVFTRFGHFPLLDPYLRVKTTTIEAPFIAPWHVLTHAGTASQVTLIVHLALAITAFFLWRRSLLSAVAAAAGLQVLLAGPFAWRYIGEGTRALSFLQVFLVLAIVQMAMTRPATRAIST